MKVLGTLRPAVTADNYSQGIFLCSLVLKNVIQSGVFTKKKRYYITLNVIIDSRVQINNVILINSV